MGRVCGGLFSSSLLFLEEYRHIRSCFKHRLQAGEARSQRLFDLMQRVQDFRLVECKVISPVDDDIFIGFDESHAFTADGVEQMTINIVESS